MALGFMRRHRRWLFVFLWLVILAFIILYIPAFQDADAGSPGETLAQVGGLPISVGEFERAYFRQRQRLEQLYQGQLDAAALERLGVREQVLASLVEERLVRLEALRLGLAVDDQALARAIAESPALQEEGRFMGAKELRKRLELQGVSEEEFAESMRNQLLGERLQALVTDGLSVTAEEAEREFRRRNEQVKAEYALVEAEPFKAEVAVSDQEVRARFESAREAYRIPERRVVSYLLVDAAALQARAGVTERDLEAHYRENQDEFRQEEQACASHILVKAKADPSSPEGHPEEEARRIAQGALDQVRSGADFAAVARKLSEDPGSASAGGDLGCFGRGRMVAEFDNAVFGLDPGQTSDLVKSGFGYHVIRLTSRREEAVPPLSQVKDRIRQALVARRTAALMEEKRQGVFAALSRGRSLEEAGRTQGLSVQKSAPLERGQSASGLDSPLLVARAFELGRGQIEPEAFAVGAGYAFIGLPEVQPSRPPELKEVQDRVRAELRDQAASQKARARAAQLRARAEKEGLEKAAAALGAVRKETPGLVGRGQPLGDLGPQLALEEAVFSLLERTVSEPLPARGGWAVVRVLEKKAFDPVAFEKERASLAASLREQRKQQLFRAYMNQARRRFPVERRPAAFSRLVG